MVSRARVTLRAVLCAYLRVTEIYGDRDAWTSNRGQGVQNAWIVSRKERAMLSCYFIKTIY